MRRATTPAAATTALRGLLVLLVAAVGLLCLLGRTSPLDTALSGPTSVSQAFCRGGPAPPHPVTTFSVLRM
ncbi:MULTISPECIES: hypothetical protein [unclassified Streptomyces]|uniref:hypothetical protein n=1 Tax=unclassified Streptomyces TaxID=2593676 RepID=UPI002788119E|nr:MULTISPECIES: hypothetical protein [unclassified Streptomyces]MDQ0694389.1 hypothetical protein [Streptomyces sp. W4I9-2]MDX3484548.1 hypothetical protein [Streptomyces sp. ID05-18]